MAVRTQEGLWARDEDPTLGEQVFSNERYGHLPEAERVLGFARLILGSGNVVDLGSHCGYTSIDYARRFPRAEVFAVEMDAENARLAALNFEAAGVADRCRVHNAAIWSDVGKVSYWANHPTTNSILTNQTGIAVEVDSITVDVAFALAGWDSVDLVKFDVEGAEWAVLEAEVDRRDWSHMVGAMVIELHGPEGSDERAAELLRQLGFSTRSCFDGHVVVAERWH